MFALEAVIFYHIVRCSTITGEMKMTGRTTDTAVTIEQALSEPPKPEGLAQESEKYDLGKYKHAENVKGAPSHD